MPAKRAAGSRGIRMLPAADSRKADRVTPQRAAHNTTSKATPNAG